MKRQRAHSRKPNLRKPLIITFCALFAAVGIVISLELTHKIDLIKKAQKPVQTNNQNTKGEPAQTPGGDDQSNNQTTTPTETKGQSGTSTNHEATLVTPAGNFVSNHHISLGNNPAVQSSCETTPGASCQIIFTKDGTTKTLETKATDSGGAAYWAWKAKDVGLTSGRWKVQAKATLDTQTKTAEDSLALEITE